MISLLVSSIPSHIALQCLWSLVNSGLSASTPTAINYYLFVIPSTPTTSKMHRFALGTALRGGPVAALPRAATTTTLRTLPARRTYASSSPKEAEAASAQSGGSRSKDAAEQAADPPAKGRTGGGEPLSSSRNPPPQPKITNASVPGEGRDKLTKEQQDEVDRHNAEFEKKHDRASTAGEDKVDKDFWSGSGGRK